MYIVLDQNLPGVTQDNNKKRGCTYCGRADRWMLSIPVRLLSEPRQKTVYDTSHMWMFLTIPTQC